MLILRATEWEYSDDRNAPPARWSCAFLESATAKLQPGEGINQLGKDHVAIDVTIDGSTERLLEGVVREWGITEGPDLVASTASGLDLKATLLDFYKSSPVTYRGMEVLSASNAPIPTGAIKTRRLGSDSTGQDIIAAYYETFQSAARKIVEATGLTAFFDCHNYDLGTDIVWEVEKTANDVLAELTAPWGITERFRLDVTVDPNDVVRFVEREHSTPDSASIAYDLLIDRKVTKSIPVAVNDVQVRGARYTYLEPSVFGDVIAYTGPYKIIERTIQQEYETGFALANLKTISETNKIKYYDAQNRLQRQTTTLIYSNYILRSPQNGQWIATLPKNRVETAEEEWNFDPVVISPPHRNASTYTKTVYVKDTTADYQVDELGSVGAVQYKNVDQYVSRDFTEYYYDALGDPIYQITKQYRAEEPAPGDSSTGLVLRSEIELHYFYSNGQRGRTTINRAFDSSSPNTPTLVTSVTEYSIGRENRSGTGAYWQNTSQGLVGSWPESQNTNTDAPSTPIYTGQRQGQGQVVSGPDDAQLKYEFAVLGNPDDATYFRGKKLQELASERYEGEFSLLPNLSIAPGMNLTVTGTPTRWETSTFFVTKRLMQHQPEQMTMNIQGVAWL